MILAHICNDKKETLEEHIHLVIESIGKDKLKILENITESFGEYSEFIYRCAVDSILMHDAGKTSPYFQYKRMNNDKYKDYIEFPSNHSMISSIIYLTKWIKEIEKRNIVNKNVEFCIYYFSFLISRHHSYLKDFDLLEFLKEMKEYLTDNGEYFINSGYTKEDIINTIDFSDDNWLIGKEFSGDIDVFILCKYLYSLILYGDFLATNKFMNGTEFSQRNTIQDIRKKYENTNVLKDIRQGKSSSEINKLRTEMFKKAESILLDNLDKRIFYLNGPCGSGKTNIMINIALKIIENTDIEKPIFVFPFNSIIEQTGDLLGNFLKEREDYIILNSSTPILANEDENHDYEQTFLDYQFINYPLILTSHVHLFNILTGTSRQDNINLCQLSNSVILLDEIQSYRNNIWNELIILLMEYAEKLNIRFVISSATLPRLDKLTSDKSNLFCDVLPDAYIYANKSVFKDRVVIKYDLLENPYNEEELISIIENNKDKNILIEFIKKRTAQSFYYKICNIFDDVFLLTGDTLKYEKKQIIEKSKTQHMILVCTQIVEAGCDIDFEIGLKDCSIIDSEEQFMGRINRNNKGNGTVYMFNCDEEKKIYKNDFRTNYSIVNKDFRKLLDSKAFDEYYNLILRDIIEEKKRYGGTNIESLYRNLKTVAFEQISKLMKLIDDNTIRLLVLDDSNKDIFQKLKDVVQSNISYAEKQIRISYLMSRLNDYLINIYPYEIKDYNVIEQFNGFLVAHQFTTEIFL